MKYLIIPYNIQLDFEKADTKESLLALARLSYDTAPQVKGGSIDDRLPLGDSELERFIKIQDGELVEFFMDIVNGRSCRTLVKKGVNYKWHLNIPGFRQRGETGEEYKEIITDPEQFVKKLKEILDGAKKDA